MRWSWRLGRVSGIKVQVHWTFLILIGWVIWSYAQQGASPAEVATGVVFVLAIFACVVLHELGHALTARHFGIATRDITLLPIGGVARLERMPDDPREELLVAIAGPAVNLVIAVVLFVGLGIAGALGSVQSVEMISGNFIVQLLVVNVVLVAFNLLPAFPMDGGRILRALLAYRLPYGRATKIAAAIGQAMAIVFLLAFVFLWRNPFLPFIAIFVYLGAQAEAQQVQVRTALEGVTVGDGMMTRFQTLGMHDTLGRAVDELLAGAQQDFPVTDGGRIVGLLIRSDLVKAVKDRGRHTVVEEIMRRDCAAVAEDDALHDALARMRSSKCSSVPVVRAGRLVGLLTLENVGEMMMVQSALPRSERLRRDVAGMLSGD